MNNRTEDRHGNASAHDMNINDMDINDMNINASSQRVSTHDMNINTDSNQSNITMHADTTKTHIDTTKTHRDNMKKALEVAKTGLMMNEVPVGCVVVRNDRVIAMAHNQTNMNSDPLEHAEFIALKKILSAGGRITSGDVFYITVEPCVMCHGILKRFGAKVVFGCHNEIFGTKKILGEYSGECLNDSECIEILKRFYEGENEIAPAEKRIIKNRL